MRLAARPTSNSRGGIKFPMHRFADTFDGIISTAVATGALGSGTASRVAWWCGCLILYSKGASASVIMLIRTFISSLQLGWHCSWRGVCHGLGFAFVPN